MPALSPIISRSSLHSQSSKHSPTGMHVQWSTPLTHTRVIPARQSCAPNTPSVKTPPINTQHSLQHDLGTIAGAMGSLTLTPPCSGIQTDQHSSQASVSNFKANMHSAVPHKLPPIPVPHLNLRFIAANHQARMPRPQCLIFNVTDQKPVANAGPQTPMVLEAAQQPSDVTMSTNTQVVSTDVTDASPSPAAMTTTTDVIDVLSSATVTGTPHAIDLTLDSDEETHELHKSLTNHKSTTQNHHDIIKDATNKRARPIDIESSEYHSSENPRKHRKTSETRSAPHLQNIQHTGSASSSSNGDIRTRPRSQNRSAPLSTLITNGTIERRAAAEPVACESNDGHGAQSIADAISSAMAENYAASRAKPAAYPRDRGCQAHDLKSSQCAVARSSRVRVEDLKDEETENGETSTRRAAVRSSVVSRKVRLWADKLREIPQARLDSLFAEEITPIPANEILGLLKDIDEHKNWVTRAEVEDARLERLLLALVNRHHLKAGSDAYNLAVRIVDNFAQRFRGERYLGRM